MRVTHVEILVEDQSTEAALRELVPRIAPGLSFQVYPFGSKNRLLNKLKERLRGYSRVLQAGQCVVILVDRDSDDCHKLKARLEDSAKQAGLVTRSRGYTCGYQVINRIAVEELEAWFFGDWTAVLKAYPRVDPNVPSRKKYRDPDAISGGTAEALERCLQQAGYFPAGLPKIEVARTIAQHMDPARNTSRSFRLFRRTIEELVSCDPTGANPEAPRRVVSKSAAVARR